MEQPEPTVVFFAVAACFVVFSLANPSMLPNIAMVGALALGALAGDRYLFGKR